MLDDLYGQGRWVLADRARRELPSDGSSVSAGGMRAGLCMFEVSTKKLCMACEDLDFLAIFFGISDDVRVFLLGFWGLAVRTEFVITVVHLCSAQTPERS